ncbi:hypothetical protein AKO1_008110 [Acrasis kona]|uniref:Major facilitator superfamily (MFS) profile domain-containing protein n=1 Tax=Acrasis kona TaxID=1008807 RepID=A0AAW2YR24_9EUKA
MATDFNWSEMTQAAVLSSFFWGYMATQIPSGLLCKKFGGRNVLLVGVVIWSIFTLLTPIAAKYASTEYVAIFFAVRIGMGLGEGANFPSAYHLCGQWVPKNERTRLMTLINSGTDFGTCTAMLLGPIMTLSMGWQYTFYHFGIMGLVWSVMFYYNVSERPEDDPSTSQQEREYIHFSNKESDDDKGDTTVSDKLSGKSSARTMFMLLSAKSVWAIIVAQTSYNFGWYILLSYLPKILLSLGIEFEKVGYFSMLSYLIVIIMSNVAAQIADTLIVRIGWSVEKTRKLMGAISFLGSSFFYFLLRFTLHDTALSVFILCCGIGCGSFCKAGYLSNYVDIAPKYAGILFGLANTFASIPGIAGPLVTGMILHHYPVDPWHVVFNIIICSNLIGAFVWQTSAKGTTQFH